VSELASPEDLLELRLRLEAVEIGLHAVACIGFVLDVTDVGRDWVDDVLSGTVKLGRQHGSKGALVEAMKTCLGHYHRLPEDWHGFPVYRLCDFDAVVFCHFAPESIAGEQAGWYLSSSLDFEDKTASIYAYAKDTSRPDDTAFPLQWHIPYNRERSWPEVTAVNLLQHLTDRAEGLQQLEALQQPPQEPQEPAASAGGGKSRVHYLGPVTESLLGDRTGGINRCAALVYLYRRAEWDRLTALCDEFEGMPQHNNGQGLGPAFKTALRGV
jgi:hypothetical protein